MVLGQTAAASSSFDPPLVDGLGGEAVFSLLDEATSASGLTRGAHRHPHGELFLLRAGYLKSQTGTGRWLIPAGHLCWVPPFAIHGTETESATGTRIHLATGLGAGLPDEPSVMSATPLIVALIDRLAAAGAIRLPSLAEPERRLLEVLCDEIDRSKSTPILLPMPRDVRLRKAVDCWLDRPDDRSGLDDLAAQAGMSRRSFTRHFRRETGLPLAEWRQIARLMHGIGMLAAGKSVTATAFALGYDSVSSFAVLCHRHTGMSPKTLARTMFGRAA